MSNLYARAVFFIKSAETARRFYTEQLGFSEDWTSPDGSVFQVSLFGFELILEEPWTPETQARIGHGRVYIGLEDDQIEPVLKHIAEKGIKTERTNWGKPTLVVRDQDANELYFWDWPEKRQLTANG